MQNSLELSPYHRRVILLYILLTPLLLILFTGRLRYDFTYENFGLISLIFILSLLGLFVFFSSKNLDRKALKFHRLASIALYAAVFAFPEEIIFRGVIQSFLQNHVTNGIIVVLLSSLFFGAAHVLNEAKSFYPSGWNWKLAGQTTLAGIPLSLLFLITNSLLIPTILHTFFVICYQLLSKDGVLSTQ